jgi:hypothetical protein
VFPRVPNQTIQILERQTRHIQDILKEVWDEGCQTHQDIHGHQWAS